MFVVVCDCGFVCCFPFVFVVYSGSLRVGCALLVVFRSFCCCLVVSRCGVCLVVVVCGCWLVVWCLVLVSVSFVRVYCWLLLCVGRCLILVVRYCCMFAHCLCLFVCLCRFLFFFFFVFVGCCGGVFIVIICWVLIVLGVRSCLFVRLLSVCLLIDDCWLLLVVCLFVVCCRLFVVRCLLFVV